MSTFLSLLPFLLVAGAGMVVWAIRMRPLAGRGPAGRVEGSAGEASLPVAVIVPARDEAANLPTLLRSLARLTPGPSRVIVVDDHSSDGTGEIARAAGATVVTPPSLPEGWLGKPWACAAGAAATDGEPWLLFTDADTEHDAKSLQRAALWAEAESLDLVSALPYHRAERTWEKLQGVFHLLLVVATAAGSRHDRASGERLFSIGQYLLFRRARYEQIGGHRAVADRVAEDVAFARLVLRSGGRFGLLVDGDRPVVRVRMYPEGLESFLAGWRRNVREGIRSSGIGGVLEVSAVLGWLLGAPVLALQGLIASDPATTVVGLVAYAAAVVEVARRQRTLGDLPWWTAPLYPLFAVLFVVVSVLAALDGWRRAPIRWRGRETRALTRRVTS